MATDRVEKKAAKSGGLQEAEQLPCPRCDSTNTKFCYYNNYNFSQPRHFCKACRRYWTHGGTLRDIPIGGATRKRSRTSYTPTTSAGYHRDFRYLPAAASQLLLPLAPNHGDAKIGGCFNTLLASSPATLGGFGVGLDEVGFGLGRPTWPFAAVVDGGAGNTWHLESGETGFVGGECFGFPDLAISTPPTFFK